MANIELSLSEDEYWTARQAVTLAIKSHQSALAGIARRKGKSLATTRATRAHEEALVELSELKTKFVDARCTSIEWKAV